MPETQALWMITTAGEPAYGADELRRADAVFAYPGPDPLSARSGIRPGHAAVSLSGQTVTVNACSGIVYPQGSPWTSVDGPYRWAMLPGEHTLTPADGTSPRIDRLVIAIQDSDIDSSGQRRAITVLKDGVPALAPTPPPLEPGELDLATIDVPPVGAPSPAPVLSPSQVYTVAAGGILPVPTRTALPGAGLYDGMAAYIMDEQALALCHSGVWVNVASRKGHQFWQTIAFTASGTFTKASFPGLRAVKARCQGGGGGGGGTANTTSSQASSSGGGGGGAYAETFVLAANLAAAEAVTVGGGGGGGNGGASAGRGATGGTSSFGSHAIAPGGDGGFNRDPTSDINVSSGASATTGGTGTLVIAGGGGSGGIAFAAGTDKGLFGGGGSAHLGGTGRTARGPSTAPANGANWGSGGSGNVSGPSEPGKTGGNGAPGIVLLDLYV